ncbi:hypothetical protein N7326_01010 [Corynebacterium sp. ES2794-CONJ1]|uniref:hypothetical protein n=1 Tax=unclassified Corynebacterium TaxID=2624378 RepID=UPI002167DBED|nr:MULTISPECIES: hypothetical protein [unclassified Corynebacterium]MCS4489219.1 hypothetical protein [Corynebacterium sp. ES2775-CONJ]MCS4491032.1 hypothetical protein [Corynebacterium sp. ES2715-CONJ3]MCS4531087.1 hypothetical protein [Corynebacterium sp. ES2730-CONJ]MCU9518454.1 hypothetical protein [Corynebacterium sp. ES2794-CONJ1]
MTTIIAVICAVIGAIFLFTLYSTAARLHRLHIRTEAALAALEAALDRRAAVFAALAPEYRDLTAGTEAIGLVPGNFRRRSEKEREIARAISADGHTVEPAIVDAQARVHIAHRFYNDAVTSTRSLRLQPVVRIFHLGGTAKLPEYFELVYDETD